jgi:hypothetical protein
METSVDLTKAITSLPTHLNRRAEADNPAARQPFVAYENLAHNRRPSLA